jgi:glucose-6-phosphate 1-dehydrogenase
MDISIIILGITGDLAKKKILPAITKIPLGNHDKLNIIGYSRSTPKLSEINSILNTDTTNVNFSYETGEYDDINKLQKLFDETTKISDRTIVYLAIPPYLFIPFLNSVCPLDPSNLSILIEKPFGQDSQEALQLIESATHCTLTDSVHFFDHYLFKTALYFDENTISSLAFLDKIEPKKITISTIEKIGLENRIGYYNSVGALKDMWQHAHSLAEIFGEYFGLDFDWQNFICNKLVQGQYESYKSLNTEVKDSNIDTYFELFGKLGGIDIVAISGKSLGYKDTSIIVEYRDNTILSWHIDPAPYLTVYSGDKLIYKTEFISNTLPEHTKMLVNLVSRKEERFVLPSQIKDSWSAYEKIINTQNKSFIIYKDGLKPDISSTN